MNPSKEAAAELGEALKQERPMKSQEFEKDVTDLIMGLSKAEFGATPMGSSVTVIKDLIEKDMLGRVTKAHASNQDELNKAAKQTQACGSTKDAQLKMSAKITTLYKGKSTLHKSC